ncbi:MAG: nucleotidyltransferase family protein [Elusimicrobiota bacterium]
MEKTRAAFPRPLDWIFSAPSHISVLRALWGSKDGLSARAAARAGGVNHQAAAVALRRLRALGVVRRLGSGGAQLLCLDMKHPLVPGLVSLLRREKRAVREAESGSRVRNSLLGARDPQLFPKRLRETLPSPRRSPKPRPWKNYRQLARELRKLLSVMSRRYGLKRLGILGSPAGDARPGSRLDLLAEFRKTPALLRFMELEQWLGDRVGVKVDLIVKDALTPAAGRRILKEVRPL